MREATFVAIGAVVFVIEFSANVFIGFRSDDLSFDRVREEAVEAVLAVAHVEVDAGVEASIDVVFTTFGRLLPLGVRAFVDCEVLVCAKSFDGLQFIF